MEFWEIKAWFFEITCMLMSLVTIILVFISVLILLTGCANTSIEIEHAIEICKPFNGIDYLYAWPTHEVMCKDSNHRVKLRQL